MSDWPPKINEEAGPCIHCGLPMSGEYGYIHAMGDQAGKQRCGSASGLPYGYNAHRIGTPCLNPCLGEINPDPRLDPSTHMPWEQDL